LFFSYRLPLLVLGLGAVFVLLFGGVFDSVFPVLLLAPVSVFVLCGGAALLEGGVDAALVGTLVGALGIGGGPPTKLSGTFRNPELGRTLGA
jgi:hypothetical protein